MMRIALLLLLALPALASSTGPDGPVLLDDGERPFDWTMHPADGVEMNLRLGVGEVDGAVRMDYAFSAGGWAILRRDLGLDLPENYALRFRLRGEGPRNHLEFKFLDASGENVWWRVLRDVTFDGTWTTYTVKKRQVEFAWGPEPGPLERIDALEIAVTAGEGGEGTLWVDSIVLEELPPASAWPPAVTAVGMGSEVVDGDVGSVWRSDGATPELMLDLGGVQEFGGWVLSWADGAEAADYRVEHSLDGDEWTTVWRAADGDARRDPIPVPEAEAAYARFRFAGPVELAEVEVLPLAWSASRESVYESEARRVRRGLYPRGIRGEQAYWTVLGLDASPWDALMGEDGAVEPQAGGPSLEPFLWWDDRLVTWADVAVTQERSTGGEPVFRTIWQGEGFRFEIVPRVIRQAGRERLGVRYAFTNEGPETGNIQIVLAARPFQVNPPSQTLNILGGTAHIDQAACRGEAIVLDGRPWAVSDRLPVIVGAGTFVGGDVVADHLARGRFPRGSVARDPYRSASAMQVHYSVVFPGATDTLGVVLAMEPDDELDGATFPLDDASRLSGAEWSARLGDFRISIPAASEVAETVLAQRTYILVNRHGPAIRPGPRSYARSWIRDGALTSWALLRTGLDGPAREFVEWYAPHQFENGKIPCVVDHRGADPVPEHDSSGEFIFLIHQLVGHTGDLDLAARMWPRVEAAADYLNRLRAERRTPAYEGTEFWGLLPPSISHEGYAAKPMHSYWDDAFCYRGLMDAARLADLLGREEDARRYRRDAEEFGRDLGASVARAMQVHGIDYIPGCADLGDFDPTSTTVLLNPGEADALMPPGAVERTFERYWEFFTARAAGEEPWDAYTPYEVRNIGAAVRLGQRDRAAAMVAWFLEHQRPAGWRHWAEVVSSQARKPRFLGDMPHTWVGSDFVRAVLDMIAYEDAARGEVVIGAGVPEAWLADGGVAVRGLCMGSGRLDVEIEELDGAWHIRIGGDVAAPAGFVVRLPGTADLRFEAPPFETVLPR